MLNNFLRKTHLSSISFKSLLFLLFFLVLLSADFVFFYQVKNALSHYTISGEIARKNLINAQKINYLAENLEESGQLALRDLEVLISEFNTRLTLLENGGDVELVGQSAEVARPDAQAKSLISKIKVLWKPYQKNLILGMHEPESVVVLDTIFYESDEIVFKPSKVVNIKRKEAIDYIISNEEVFLRVNEDLGDYYIRRFYDMKSTSQFWAYLLLGLNAVFILLGYFAFRKKVMSHVNRLPLLIQRIFAGDINLKSLRGKKNKEIKDVYAALSYVNEQLDKSAEAVEAIGEGRYDDLKVDQGTHLGSLLARMGDQLRQAEEAQRKRAWVNEGVTFFNEILRRNYDSFETFSYEIIAHLIQYIGATQGAFFSIIEEEEMYLNLDACYAYDRRRFENKKIPIDDGLLSQVVKENQATYLTEVPEGYLSITSGLGDTEPAFLLIVPLSYEGDAYGALGIASLKEIAAYKIDFVKKIAENVANFIATLKLNDQTNQLLKDSQEFSEQLKAHEREMKSHIEALTTTQEALAKQEQKAYDDIEATKMEYLQKMKEELKAKDEEINALKAEIAKFKK